MATAPPATGIPVRLRMPSVFRHVLGVLMLALMAGNAGADSLPDVQPRIVNGVLTSSYATTGALLLGADADTASMRCSGTLIGCSTFLTAGHCVEGLTPGVLHVFLPNAGLFSVMSIALHPEYDFPAADVAVLKLVAAVDGLAPSAIESSAPVPFGTTGAIAGYGRAGGVLYDYGLKRAGNVVTAACATIPPPGSDTTSVCWDFVEPKGPPGSNSNTCNADSGGPLFVDLGFGPRVAGITSGGSASSCQPTDHSYDASVYNYRSFIQTQGGADLANTSCGTGPQVGGPGANVIAFDGELDGVTDEVFHSFTVPNGTNRVRIALNAVDDGPSDFDLYVKAGSVPTTSVYDCGRFGPNQFGVCDIAAPATGTWHVLVDHFSGAGAYQLTVTTFGTTCSAPGSDGNPCDDDNVCTTAETCQAGSCVGTPLGDGTPCSDGNACTGPDTCQAGVCDTSPLANGTPCDDGDPCSRPDTCQAGACAGVAPALTCKSSPAGSALLAIDNRSPDTRDRFGWTWRKGSATTLAELGNPTTVTPYVLCVYDSVAGVPQRRMTKVIPPGSRWKGSTRGFRFRDTTATTGGLQSIVLTKGTAGHAGVQVRGKGQPLALPGLPFAKQPNVIVQLLNDTTCWSSTHTTAATNSIARFKAKNQ